MPCAHAPKTSTVLNIAGRPAPCKGPRGPALFQPPVAKPPFPPAAQQRRNAVLAERCKGFSVFPLGACLQEKTAFYGRRCTLSLERSAAISFRQCRRNALTKSGFSAAFPRRCSPRRFRPKGGAVYEMSSLLCKKPADWLTRRCVGPRCQRSARRQRTRRLRRQPAIAQGLAAQG